MNSDLLNSDFFAQQKGIAGPPDQPGNLTLHVLPVNSPFPTV